MSFKKFCPKCGKETDKFVGKICLDCFLKEKNLFSIKKQKMFVCKHCGKILVKGKWQDFSESLIIEEITSKVKINKDVNLENINIIIDLVKKDDEKYEALVKVKGIVEGNLIDGEKVIQIKISITTCDACMKLNSEYREAIIQLRGKNLEESKEMMKNALDLLDKERAKDSLSGTSKIIELKEGYDLWVGSKKAAAKVSKYMAKMYNTQVKLSSKLIGEEQSGKRKYRFTFCIKN